MKKTKMTKTYLSDDYHPGFDTMSHMEHIAREQREEWDGHYDEYGKPGWLIPLPLFLFVLIGGAVGWYWIIRWLFWTG